YNQLKLRCLLNEFCTAPELSKAVGQIEISIPFEWVLDIMKTDWSRTKAWLHLVD
ncbi:hypothetical protein AVEN_226071-2-1, partial [Araneus ventricosus]